MSAAKTKRPAKPPASSSPRSARAAVVAQTKAVDDSDGSRRRVIVFTSLVGVMSLTSLLLWTTRAAPLLPDAAMSLLAIDGPRGVDAAFLTRAPLQAGRWKYIYVHHSRTAGGSASSLAEGDGGDAGLADHFVIGNGLGMADGEIQIGQRWNHQHPAGDIAGLNKVSPDCISICLIGDFDRTRPTRAQSDHLGKLVRTLQERLRIGRDRVWVVDAIDSPAGPGRNFPKAAFRQQLLP